VAGRSLRGLGKGTFLSCVVGGKTYRQKCKGGVFKKRHVEGEGKSLTMTKKGKNKLKEFNEKSQGEPVMKENGSDSN